MTTFGATKTFRNVDDATMLAGVPQGSHALLVYVFLAVSALSLIAIAAAHRKVAPFFASRLSVAIAGACGTVGTGMLVLGAGASTAALVVAAVLMGLCAGMFVILLGNAFATFEFATCVLNSAVSVAVGFICAVAFVNWIPSPASGVVAMLMPVLMTCAFWKKKHSEPGSAESGIEGSYMRLYLVQFAVSIMLFGFVLGALRVVCADKLLSTGGVTIELLLGLGCILSVLLFIVAIATSKKETLWDSILRYLMPVVALGLVCIALLPSEFGFVATFLTALGFATLASMMWLFVACMARSLNGSSIIVFGIGYGLGQLTSALGSMLAANLVPEEAIDVVSAAALGQPIASISQLNDLQGVLSLALLALVLCAVLSFAYALFPRYREIRRVFSTVLSELLQNREAPRELGATDELQGETPDLGGTAAGMTLLRAPEVILDESPHTPTGEEPSPEHVAAEKTQPANDPQVEAEEHASADADAQPPREEKGSFVRRCEELSGTYGLSTREKEVFFLLAKGHNAAFITEKLCISRSTAKTHINHIYKKMDIHTQQEVLNMVEDRARGPHGADIDRDAIREALERNPSQVVEHIHRDYIGF